MPLAQKLSRERCVQTRRGGAKDRGALLTASCGCRMDFGVSSAFVCGAAGGSQRHHRQTSDHASSNGEVEIEIIDFKTNRIFYDKSETPPEPQPRRIRSPKGGQFAFDFEAAPRQNP